MQFNQYEFGKRVQSLRKAKKLTQEQLADLISISPNYLAKIESGSRSCSIDLLLDIALQFQVSTDYLLTGKEINRSQEKERLLLAIQSLTEIAQKL